MSASELATTVVSTQGRVTLPKSIRDGRGWSVGTRLIVEDIDDGVLLKPVALFAPTRLADVVGCLACAGTPKSIEDMDAAIETEIRRPAEVIARRAR